MNRLILLGLLLMPVLASAAATDCRVQETPDRFEVVCTGDPVSKIEPAPAEVTITPVQGKHRPEPRQMDQERASRLRQINDQLPVAGGAITGERPKSP